MNNRSTTRRSVWMLAASLSTLTACGDATAPATGGDTNLSLSFAAQTSTPGVAKIIGPGALSDVSLAVATNAVGNVIVTGTANDTLVITGVQLVLNNVELRRADVTSCPTALPERTSKEHSADDKGCSRLDLGPMLLDLPLSDVGTSKLAVAIPAGSYREIEFELDKVRTGSNATPAELDFVARNPDFVDRTVRVTGTYKGQPFTFTSKVEAEVEMEFDPAILVEAGSNDNITVALDLARWFRNSAGALLVPTAENQSRIEQNIATSFDVFGDRNRDGKEDEGRKRSRSRSAKP